MVCSCFCEAKHFNYRYFYQQTNGTNMRALVFRRHLLEALSLRNMAASTRAANAAASNPQGPASVGPSVDSPTLQYSMILEHLIGDKRPVKDLNPAVMGGLPVPPKSDEQKMIERGMESCAFKSLLACVGGKRRH